MVACSGTTDQYAYTTAATVGTLMVLDVARSEKRYAAPQLTKDSTNAFRGNVVGIAYRGKYLPSSPSTTNVLSTVTTVSPST